MSFNLGMPFASKVMEFNSLVGMAYKIDATIFPEQSSLKGSKFKRLFSLRIQTSSHKEKRYSREGVQQGPSVPGTVDATKEEETENQSGEMTSSVKKVRRAHSPSVIVEAVMRNQ